MVNNENALPRDAVIGGPTDLVERWLQNGNDPDDPEFFLSTGWRPLHYAVLVSTPEIIERLLDRDANIEAEDRDQRTPLHFAARFNRPDVAEALLDRGANIEAEDRDQRTPLHLAAKHKCPDSAKFLRDKGANVEARDRGQKTPRQLAEEFRSVEVIAILLETRPD